MKLVFKYFRRMSLILVAFVLAENPTLLAAPLVPICEEMCSTAECAEPCYENMMEFGNGNDITCLEFGTFDPDQYCCGDFLCNTAADEGIDNCTDDCAGPIPTVPVCGQYGCQQGENCMNCAGDCGGCGSASSCDADGRCESGEDTYCDDCKATGYCTSNGDCPTFQGGTFHYTCVDDRCILSDLPFVSNTCNENSDCNTGQICKRIVDGYHGSDYNCPDQQTVCTVCVPDWFRQ